MVTLKAILDAVGALIASPILSVVICLGGITGIIGLHYIPEFGNVDQDKHIEIVLALLAMFAGIYLIVLFVKWVGKLLWKVGKRFWDHRRVKKLIDGMAEDEFTLMRIVFSRNDPDIEFASPPPTLWRMVKKGLIVQNPYANDMFYVSPPVWKEVLRQHERFQG